MREEKHKHGKPQVLPGQKKKKWPLGLCIKSEHCSCHAISREWHGGAACRDFAQRCAKAQSSLIFRYPQCSDFMPNRSGRFFLARAVYHSTWFSWKCKVAFL